MSNPESASNVTVSSSHGKKKRRTGRFFLFLGPVVVLAISGYVYLGGGRYVKTDNAYVQADKVIISSEVSGPITSVKVVENQHVNAGDALFTLDNRTYSIAVDQANARLQEVLADIRTQKASYRQKVDELELARSNIRFADNEYRRRFVLANTKAVAQAQLDDAQHTLEVSRKRQQIIQGEMEQILARLEGDPEVAVERLASYRFAQAQLEQAALDLERTEIRAPFAGTVSKIPQEGKHVDPGTSVMGLVADNNFWIEANVKEISLAHVHTGQQVSITVDAYPDTEWSGRVESISPATGSEFSIIPAQNATGNWVKVVQRVTLRISVNSTSEAPALRSGMSADISIDTGYRRPLPALVRKGLDALGMNSYAMADHLD
jgi:membrane fusion protein (multidrug efflux system)